MLQDLSLNKFHFLHFFINIAYPNYHESLYEMKKFILFNLLTDDINGKKLKVWWYDPRTGDAFPQGIVENTGEYAYSAWQNVIRSTQDGPDWVIVIDDAGANYAPPGRIHKE